MNVREKVLAPVPPHARLCPECEPVHLRTLERLGRLDEDAFPQDALQALQAASIQRRLPFPLEAESPPPRKRLCASFEGFSLHADTHAHAHD